MELSRKCWASLAIGCMSISASTANAIIIEGNFKARVSDINTYVEGDNLFGDISLGQQISGKFWYDTSLMGGGPSVADPNVAWYGGRDNWLNVAYEINGKTFQVTQGPADFPEVRPWELISIQKYDPDLWWDIVDMYAIYQEIQYNKPDSLDYHLLGASITLWYGLDVLNYVDLIQDFSLHAQNEWDIWGYANLNITQIENSQGRATDIEAEIYDFNIGPRQEASVSEPPAITLFGLALLLLAWCIRKKSNRSDSSIQ